MLLAYISRLQIYSKHLIGLQFFNPDSSWCASTKVRLGSEPMELSFSKPIKWISLLYYSIREWLPSRGFIYLVININIPNFIQINLSFHGLSKTHFLVKFRNVESAQRAFFFVLQPIYETLLVKYVTAAHNDDILIFPILQQAYRAVWKSGMIWFVILRQCMILIAALRIWSRWNLFFRQILIHN